MQASPASPMSTAPRQHAPLYSAGVPGWVRVALAAAGLPMMALEAAEWVGQSSHTAAPLGLVLFDSRTPNSRANAQGVRNRGLTTLDVAPLAAAARRRFDERVSAERISTGVFAEFLARLKDQVEASGFLWTRLADVPHPFRTLRPETVGDGGLSVPAPRLAKIPESNSGENATVEPAGDLIWRAASVDVLRWREFRGRVRVQISEAGRHLDIHCELPGPEFRPTLEVWRGGHFACLPLKPGRFRVNEAQLPFESAEDRHPGGFLAWTAFDLRNTDDPSPAMQAS
jgi:hypothetical protein